MAIFEGRHCALAAESRLGVKYPGTIDLEVAEVDGLPHVLTEAEFLRFRAGLVLRVEGALEAFFRVVPPRLFLCLQIVV